MTEDDKAPLHQYEGAGGLSEADTTTRGTLYEFYTPRNVVNKVWQLIDKYLPWRKTVLEPGVDIGRFVENRPLDKFTLNELDDVSSRIAGILNLEAEITHGTFQELSNHARPMKARNTTMLSGIRLTARMPGFGKARARTRSIPTMRNILSTVGLTRCARAG
jgi:hypothetical protein